MAIDETTDVSEADRSWEEVLHPDAEHPADELLVPMWEEDVTPTLSIVLPTLNEEDGIAECITRAKNALAELDVTAEIIVSDSSSDRTPKIAQSMGAHVIRPDESGYGYAYLYAFEQARGRYIAMGDADTTYDFEELPKLFECVRDDGADICIGSRRKGEIKPGAMPRLHRYVGNPLLTRFLNAFYDVGVSDAHSGFRVFHRGVLETLDLQSDGMEFASEMVMDAGAMGLEIAEVPITYYEREGEATLNSFQDGWRHVKFMLMNAPGYLFSVPGLVMGIVGMTLMGFAIGGVQIREVQFSAFWQSGLSFGVRSMVAGALLTMVGYQVATMGLFATVSTNPIRRPNDSVTVFLERHLSLERGILVGLAILGIGISYLVYEFYTWLVVGYAVLPPVTRDILALTAVVVGMQTVFGSFLLSAMANTSSSK